MEWRPLPSAIIAAEHRRKTEEAPEIVVAGYPFLDVVWTTVLVVAFVVFVWMVVSALGDVYRRDDIGGAQEGRLGRCSSSCVPLVGVFAYLIANGDGMARRSAERRRRRERPARQVCDRDEHVKRLLDSGAITQAEFDAIAADAAWSASGVRRRPRRRRPRPRRAPCRGSPSSPPPSPSRRCTSP